MVFDEDMLDKKSRRRTEDDERKQRSQIEALQAELTALLKEPLLPAGAKRRFITANTVPLEQLDRNRR